MTLSKAEWRKRVKAAAALHGWELSDLNEPVARMAGKGTPIDAARRAGHESDDSYGPNHALALILAELLEVPVAWFEEEDWRPLLRESPEVAAAESPVTMETFLQAKTEVLQAVEEARIDLGGQRRKQPPDESTGGAGSN